MRDYTYNFEIEDLIVQFIDAFNDVVIKRYNKDRAEEDQILVNFVYAPKKRVLYDIVNKNPNPRNLPIISVYINSIDRDRDRVENKIENSYFVNDSGNPKQRRQPVPVKVQMSMSVITKSTNDMLQILSNWVPYADPYIYIDVTDPSTKQTLRTKVEWSGSIIPEQEIDEPENSFRTGFSTSFTIYGYLFKKIIEDGGNICKITTNMSSVTSLNKCFFDLKEFETSIGLTSAYKSTFVINGVPYLKCINPTYLVLGHEKYDFTITGKNLDFTSHLFVSGQPGMFPASAYSYYNFFPNLSTVSAISPCAEVPATTTIVVQSNCQPFSAIPISAFTVTENGQSMQFTLPYNPEVFGVFDIIATSKCGCARLSLDSILDEINPYPPGTPEYENFIPYQPPPAVNGGVVVVPTDFQSIMSRISALESLTARSVNTSVVVETNSAYWNQSYTTLTAYSALWSTGGAGGASVAISSTAPSAAKNGDLWWDSNVGNGYIWYVDNDGGQWVPFANILVGYDTLSVLASYSARWDSTYTVVSSYSALWMEGGGASVAISSTAPTSAKNGDLWWDSNVGNGYIWYVDNDGGQWVPFASIPESYNSISIIQSNSARWDSSFTALTNTSSNWNSTYSTVQSNSSKWGSRAMLLTTWLPKHNQPPSANFATLDTRGGIDVLDFSETTQNAAIFPVVIPINTNFTGGIEIAIRWACSTETNALCTVGWIVDMQSLGVSSLDVVSTIWSNSATIIAATVPTTLGVSKVTSTTIGYSALSTLSANDYFRVRIRRDINNDFARGDVELISVQATILQPIS